MSDDTPPETRDERTDPSLSTSTNGTTSASALPWHPANPGRWAALNLADPDPTAPGYPPQGGTIADGLVWAIVEPGADDPVVGIVDAVRTQLTAIAHLMGDRMGAVPDMLLSLERKLATAVKLLAFTDEREPMPLDPSGEETEGVRGHRAPG